MADDNNPFPTNKYLFCWEWYAPSAEWYPYVCMADVANLRSTRYKKTPVQKHPLKEGEEKLGIFALIERYPAPTETPKEDV